MFSERARGAMLLGTSGSGLGGRDPTFTDKGTIRKPQPRERGRWPEGCKPPGIQSPCRWTYCLQLNERLCRAQPENHSSTLDPSPGELS